VVGTASPSRTITFANNQTTALSLSKSITGTNPGDFAITGGTCGTSVAAKSQCTILVNFAPTTTGSRAATLTIADSPDPDGPYNIGLTGWAVAPVKASPVSDWFGTRTVGSSTTLTTTVTNYQSVAVSLTWSIAGAKSGDFAITGGTCATSLGANSQCTILLSFTPAATGNRSAALTIAASPDSSSPHNIGLSGIGS
jgi:hypothetical protein